MADQMDVLCHLALREITQSFDQAKAGIDAWQPKPCPPPPERRNRWTRTSSRTAK